jgi:hypothetical protein
MGDVLSDGKRRWRLNARDGVESPSSVGIEVAVIIDPTVSLSSTRCGVHVGRGCWAGR